MTAKDRRDDMPVLVVDLDGTLIRSDTLYESFWCALSKSWRTLPEALRGLSEGRASLKRRLVDMAELDAAHLPYDDTVLDYIRNWRADGGRAVLVTAADQAMADKVAAHVDLFDEAHGSDGETNLKGANKATFLTKRYGETGFAYMGDSTADLPVWQAATKAVTVNVSDKLAAEVAALPAETVALRSGAGRPAYLKALRPHQWMKNVLVFLPVFAAHDFSAPVLFMALLTFAAFSLVSSSGYVLNDLMDLRADRAHPRKCTRPIAAGDVPIAHATAMVPILLVAGLVLAGFAGMLTFAVIALYFVLTTLYSLVLKRLAIADICTLALLYTLRIIAGGLATGLGLSVWLLAFSMFFFFALAAVKRQAELIDMGERGVSEAKRRGYHVDDLPLISQITVASGFVSVLVLALYLNSPVVQQLYSAPWLLWGICLILLYWITRIVLVTHRGKMHDDPVVYALRDRNSQICLLLMTLFGFGAAAL